MPSCSARTRCPASFRVTPEDPDRSTTIVAAPRSRTGTPQLAAIDEVRNREEDTDKILSATGLVKALTAGLAALLVLASIALIANTIRLSIFARRREVEVMKLVGATNWFIRWPFVIEGVIVGFFGGLLAVLLLTIAKKTFIDPLSDRFALLAAPDTIDFPLLVIVLMLSPASPSPRSAAASRCAASCGFSPAGRRGRGQLPEQHDRGRAAPARRTAIAVAKADW